MSPKPERPRRAGALWRVVLAAPDAEAAAAATDAFGEFEAVSVFEERQNGPWRVEGFAREKPERGPLLARLALAWLRLGGAPPEPHWEKLPPQDWVGINQASFAPLAVGRFFIHGSHDHRRVPPARIALEIDAATAFGTGEHATTRGCLLALDALSRRGPRRILDMGTGTGILAMAAAKRWHRRVVARDIDPESVRVAAHNARRNGVARLVAVSRSAGYRERGVARRRPYDLVLSNILARPLERLARDLRCVLAPDGIAVLSGLLSYQEPGVLAAHRLLRLRLKQRIVIDGWSTLVVGRGRSSTFRMFRKNRAI
ncbi:MAG TPA: 50S ribosomal protein L11 methyltransferase [Stellaceae bacterium]|nr:50S ribosomal protein L11 methyltransferase [Stellaceae bacterium]